MDKDCELVFTVLKLLISSKIAIYTMISNFLTLVNCDRPGECSPEKDCLR